MAAKIFFDSGKKFGGGEEVCMVLLDHCTLMWLFTVTFSLFNFVSYSCQLCYVSDLHSLRYGVFLIASTDVFLLRVDWKCSFRVFYP